MFRISGSEVNSSYLVSFSAVPERISHFMDIIKIVNFEGVPIQHEINRARWIPKVELPLISKSIAPKTPDLRSVRGDFEPVMTNEGKVMGSLLQSAKPTPKADVSAEDVSEYFGRESGYIEKRVPDTFERCDGYLVLYAPHPRWTPR